MKELEKNPASASGWTNESDDLAPHLVDGYVPPVVEDLGTLEEITGSGGDQQPAEITAFLT